MANSLYGFNKTTDARYLIGEIEDGFSIAENLNGTPSNMKVIIVNDEQEEYAVNTICYHDHTDTWWVISADTSTYLPNGDYKHEIELIEGFEWFNFKTLTDCAFKQGRYTLETMLQRLFLISKITCALEFADFIDEDKNMKYMAFTNYTVASAITQIAKSVLAIPKLKWTNGATLSGMTLYFVSRIGDDTKTIITDVDTSFPVAYEQNASSKDQFKTRAISNMSNAKSQTTVLSPKIGGYRISTDNSYKIDTSNMMVSLPSRIDAIEYICYVPAMYITYDYDNVAQETIWIGFYLMPSAIKEVINDYLTDNSTDITPSDIADVEMPKDDWLKVGITSQFSVDDGYVNDDTFYCGSQILRTQREFNETKTANGKDFTWRQARTWYWQDGTNNIVVPAEFSEAYNSVYTYFEKIDGAHSYRIAFRVYAASAVNYFFKVAYKPIADIKVSYDNNSDASDERYYNQSGQIIDATTASKLVYTDVMESADGTKIRQAKHSTWASCISLGQLVKIDNDIWVVNQRSIDYSPSLYGAVAGYYSAIYNLSKDRVARSEFINADSSIISSAPPDKNLIERNELFKDYVELSLDETHMETAYYETFLDDFQLTTSDVGLDLNMIFMGRSELAASDIDFMVMPSLFELTKSKLLIARFPDNNYIGQRLDVVESDIEQTTINYVETDGSSPNVYGYFVNEADIMATNALVTVSNPELLPFNDYPELPDTYFDTLETNPAQNWSIICGVPSGGYDKDPYEIPVFSYQIQINDSAGASGQIIIGDDILQMFSATGEEQLKLYYVISSTTRFTNDSADKIWASSGFLPYAKFISAVKGTGVITMTLYELTGTPNSTALQGKHIGIYAVRLNDGGGFDEAKFLFGINFYQGISNSVLPIYVNNWKI